MNLKGNTGATPLTDKRKSHKQVLIMVMFNKLGAWEKSCLMGEVDVIEEAAKKTNP